MCGEGGSLRVGWICAVRYEFCVSNTVSIQLMTKNMTKTAKMHENVIVERFFRANPVDRLNFNLFLEYIMHQYT